MKRKLKQRIASVSMVLVMTTSLGSGIPSVKAKIDSNTWDGRFKTQVGGTYDGMPLFDAVPEHLEQYLDAYLEYVGLEGAAVYATDTRQDYTLTTGANAGKIIPGAAQAHDHVQGVSTDFPSMVGLGQTWNQELLNQVGTVMGNEQINTVDYGDTANFNPVMFSLVSDLRINPLSGRIDESYSEDPFLTGTLINSMATGMSGVTEDDNFWLKAITGTKHFTNYAAQWFRQSGSIDTSIRGLLEYQTRSVLKGVESGAVAGTMTSYGRTNGIPNIISPFINELKELAPYSFYTSPDANAYNHMTSSAFSNGYDTKYTEDATTAIALFMIANSTAGGSSFGKDHTVPLKVMKAVEQGYYGVTADDVYETARAQLTQLVRVGLFNERDGNNLPIGYPYLDLSKGQGTTSNVTTEHNKETALQTAEESIVLLKNDKNVLPLDKSDDLVVLGELAAARFKTVYSVNTTPQLENTSLSPINGLKVVGDAEKIDYENGNQVVAFRSRSTGKYLTADTGEGGVLYATLDDPQASAAQFELYDWGQDGYSILARSNGKWVANKTVGGGGWGSSGTLVGIENTGTESLNTPENPWDNGLNVGASTMPSVYRMMKNEDGSISFVANSYGGGFGGGYEYAYFGGQYFSVGDDGAIGISGKLTSNQNAATICTDAEKFDMVVLQKTGEAIKNYTGKQKKDYAVVVVGAPTKHSAGEGSDRSDLAMGEEQYELVKTVAAQYPRKTIVVVKSSFPVLMEAIQNNKDVAAIVYQPYAGQYDGYALAEAIYGDVTPTGRLTSTWYASMEALPEISEYSFADGNTYTLDTVDPRFTVDLTNSDPMQSNLTYMYTNAKTTYEFGYGLTYSDMKYNKIRVEDVNAKTGDFTVYVDVTNKGKFTTSEVVQAYITNNTSSYGGSATPKKQLVSFDKVELKPGETKTVKLNVLGDDYAVWSTNDERYMVEKGNYTVAVGKSSKIIEKTVKVNITGEKLGEITGETGKINVFDRSYAASDVTYREVSKDTTVQSLKAEEIAGGYSAVMSKKAGAWTAIHNVKLTEIDKIKVEVATTNARGKISIRLDSSRGKKIAEFNFAETQPITKVISGGTATGNISTTELGYTMLEDAIDEVKGVHNIYIVFEDKDVRINTIEFITEE